MAKGEDTVTEDKKERVGPKVIEREKDKELK